MWSRSAPRVEKASITVDVIAASEVNPITARRSTP
jgi:hypothetical protein